MSWWEYISSILEVCFLYEMMVLFDKNNKVSNLRLITMITVLTTVLVILNVFNLSYFMLFSTISLLLIFYLFIRCNLIDLVTDLVFALIVLSCIQILFFLTLSIFNLEKIVLEISDIFLCILMLLLITIINRKNYFNKFFHKFYVGNRRLLLLVEFNMIFIIIVITDIWDRDTILLFQEKLSFSLILISYILINLLLLGSLVRVGRERIKNKRFIMYGSYLKDTLYKLKKNEHDFRGHLNAIVALVDQSKDEKNKEDVIKYIEKIYTQDEQTNISGITDNTVISSFLYYIKKTASEKNIEFIYSNKETNPEYKIGEHDLIEILSNLFNNAIDAVDELDEKRDKNIYVLFDEKFIKISNPASESIDKTDIQKFVKEGYSSKGENRGFGLSNVISLAKKNNIIFNMDVDKNEMIITLIFK